MEEYDDGKLKARICQERKREREKDETRLREIKIEREERRWIIG